MRNNFAAAASPDNFLNARLRGSFNETVFNAQIWMTLTGHDPGPMDGLYGSQTARGLNQFLGAAGDTPDGTISLAQYNALAASALEAMNGRVQAVAERGDSVVVGSGREFSEYTRDAQIMIRALDIDPGPIDGLYGSRTQAGIEAYQRANGMEVTGVLTAQQYSELFDRYQRTVGEHLTAAAAHTAAAPADVSVAGAGVAEVNRGMPAQGSGSIVVPPGGFQRVVIHGDSIGEGIVGAARSSAGIPVVDQADPNLGLRNEGATMSRDELAASVSNIRPGDLVVVSLGANDAGYYYNNPQAYAELLGERIDAIMAQGVPAENIVLLGMNANDWTGGGQNGAGMNDRWRTWNDFVNGDFGDAVRSVAESRGTAFIDRTNLPPGSDGLHGNYQALFGAVVAEAGGSLTQPQATPTDPEVGRDAVPGMGLGR